MIGGNIQRFNSGFVNSPRSIFVKARGIIFHFKKLNGKKFQAKPFKTHLEWFRLLQVWFELRSFEMGLAC